MADNTRQQAEVEDSLAYLKQHDGEWLTNILRERCKELGYHKWTQEREAASRSLPHASQSAGTGTETGTGLGTNTSLVGPHDVTAPTLPPGRVISEHVRMLRDFPFV